MEGYLLHRGRGFHGLAREPIIARPLAPDEVRVRVHAVTLNARDLNIARVETATAPLVPCSDGAGQIVETGASVDAWQAGDRVTAAFYPHWVSGRPRDEDVGAGLGGGGAGMLADEVILPAKALVRIPPGMSYLDAAALPCAGVTAWNALFRSASPRPGDTVLVQGTGGVSVLALQIAAAAGLRVIATSSQVAKLAVSRELGAHETICRASEGWTARVLMLTRGNGADLVLDVGGRDGIAHSIACTRMEGTVAMVGGLTGFGVELAPFALIDRAVRLVGVLVGSREMLQELVDFASTTRLKPRIDKVFGFGQAREAYEYLAGGRHVGKVAIDVSGQADG